MKPVYKRKKFYCKLILKKKALNMNSLNFPDEKSSNDCQKRLIDVDGSDGNCMLNPIKKEAWNMQLRESNVIINENYRRSAESISKFHPDVIMMKLSTEPNGNAQNGHVEAQRPPQSPPPTSYAETLIHLFKGLYKFTL